MIKLIAGVLLIAFSYFMFAALVTSYEIEKGNVLTASLILLKSPPSMDDLNAKILYSNIAGYLSVVAGAFLVLWGIYSIYRRRRGRAAV